MSSLGIDIRHDRVCLVFLKTSFRGMKLAAHATYFLEKEKPLKEKLNIVRELVTGFMRENQINGSTLIFIGIPCELAIFRTIEFPLAVRENLGTTLRYEMEKYVPIPADEVVFDYHILSEDKGKNRLSVLLLVAKKNAVMPYVNFSTTLANGISGIETDATAMTNFIACASDKGEIDLTRDLPEILSGKAFHNMKAVRHPHISLPSEDLIPACGLALKESGNIPIHINLLPPEFRKKPSKAGYYIMAGLMLMTLLSGAAWGGSYFLQQRLRLNAVNAEISKLEAEVEVIERIRTESEKLEKKITSVNQLKQKGRSVLDILREMTEIIPESAWIRDFSFSEKGIQLNGYADSASELIPLLDASPMFEEVGFSSAITKDKDGKERFRIGMKVKAE